ncbi:MAG TPA: DUF4038 domain-containing protein [Pricia sp.]|nr:DUF4038 domain-containing protein [Pricia sp.]
MIAIHRFSMVCYFLFFLAPFLSAQNDTPYPIWEKVELAFTSNAAYDNALYDVREFGAVFTSPTGKTKKLNGFWDGGKSWKIRMLPDEIGIWEYETFCSDGDNIGLAKQSGKFRVAENKKKAPLYRHGALTVNKGDYHVSYNDGTPFFWAACTAWNGALKSTDEGWETYLEHRLDHHYTVIQYVTTQWRGAEANAEGEKAFSGNGPLAINIDFFKRIDKRTDQINDNGLVAAPVLLWALPSGPGRHLSPGYALPTQDAVRLAKYIVARLQGNHVVWLLGGDGNYKDPYEQRWKHIGQQVFDSIDNAPVTLHPQGSSWIGELFKEESWLDIIAYQSSHSNERRVVDWINKGPMANTWHRLPPRPFINMEPNYEEINFKITAEDVRNASYWSLFATPVSGITYGANGIWPWIQNEGDLIENHRNPEGRGPSTWRKSIEFPGSRQIGLLSEFMQRYDWWTLRPAPGLLVGDPTSEGYDRFIPVVSDNARDLVMAYVPHAMPFTLRLPFAAKYRVQWFDPISGTMKNADFEPSNGAAQFEPPADQDWVLVLERANPDH